MGSSPLKLNEFKAIYDQLKYRLPPWGGHLLLGLLVWLEEKYIQYRTVEAVDEAIEKYETLYSPPEVVIAPPVYSETGDDFFDEMRLTAPWKAQEGSSDSPQVH